MLPFDFHLPTKIYFGPGKFDNIGGYVAPIGKRALIVTGKSAMRRLGFLDKAVELLRIAGVDSIVFEGIEPNPRHTTCDQAASIARNDKCDVIIGIGGGSAMDAAKGIAATAKIGHSIWEYVYTGPGKPQRRITQALPIVCIPTIAATGSTESMSQLEYLVKQVKDTASDARRILPVPPCRRARMTVKTASDRKNIVGMSTSMPGTWVSRYGIPRSRAPAMNPTSSCQRAFPTPCVRTTEPANRRVVSA